MGDRPTAITKESWPPPLPHEGPDLTHDWLEGHAETVRTFSWVVPLQPLPILLPLDTRLGIPAHSAWQPHGGAQCQRLVGWSLEDDGRQSFQGS